MDKNLSIGLGSSGVTLHELISAYSAFANNGIRVESQGIRYIENRNGEILYTENQKKTQPISSGMANIITSLLQSVVKEGTAKKVRSLGRPTAGKTGTTNNYVDAWFIGYTPKLLTGVWVGKDNVEPLGRNETGSRTAIPIWLEFMKSSLANKPIYNFPTSSETTFVKVDPTTGNITNSKSPKGFFEIFANDNLPKENSQYQKSVTAENF